MKGMKFSGRVDGRIPSAGSIFIVSVSAVIDKQNLQGMVKLKV
jgi:hypothetical protein